MHRRRKSSFLPVILVLLFLLTGAGILRLGVPILAEKSFGAAASNLTSMQKWTYSLKVIAYKNKLLNPVSQDAVNIRFVIQPGEAVTTTAISLENNGLIPNWSAFRNYVIYKGLDTQIKAGEFNLSPSMTPIQISQAILSNYSEEVSFYIYPGWRAEEVAASLPTSGIEVTPEAFLAVVQNPSNLELPASMTGVTSLEGFLFPGEYTIKRDVSPEELAMIFVQRFFENVTPEIQQNLQANGLSFYEAVILASIIQRETFDDSERGMIASVFYNRLAAGMKLETDPTVQYALGYSAEWGGWWKTPLLVNDLSVQSPFNTYLISGLPNQPISNPALVSIQAVENPESSSFYYFRAKCDGSGSHVFAQTFEEHLSNACE